MTDDLDILFPIGVPQTPGSPRQFTQQDLLDLVDRLLPESRSSALDRGTSCSRPSPSHSRACRSPSDV
jgi:hypothetical protein